MPEENIAALTAELESLKAENAKRDAKDAETATTQAKLAAELETLKVKAADAERRAEQAAAMQRSLEADAFVERNSKQDCLRLTNAESRDRARALWVRLAASGEAVVSEAESVTLKLTAPEKPRTFTAAQLFEAFVESLPDQKVLMTSSAVPGKPNEPSNYEELKASLKVKHNIDTTTAEGRAQLMRLTTEAVKENPEQYGFRPRVKE